MSEDKKLQHKKCPKGLKSWCFYQRAIASGEIPKSQKFMKTYVSEDIIEKILPFYQRLVSQGLFLRSASAKNPKRWMKAYTTAFGKNAFKRYCNRKKYSSYQ